VRPREGGRRPTLPRTADGPSASRTARCRVTTNRSDGRRCRHGPAQGHVRRVPMMSPGSGAVGAGVWLLSLPSCFARPQSRILTMPRGLSTILAVSNLGGRRHRSTDRPQRWQGPPASDLHRQECSLRQLSGRGSQCSQVQEMLLQEFCKRFRTGVRDRLRTANGGTADSIFRGWRRRAVIGSSLSLRRSRCRCIG